jgi:hypothetical protein
LKAKSKTRNAHTANTKFGMGDFYGSGVRSKVGRIRDVYEPGVNPMKPKALKKPPKSLA